MAMALAASMLLPPPRPTTKSQPSARAKAAPVHDVVQHGVCQDLVEHGVGDPGLGQLVLDDVQVAVGAGGLAGGNDDEGLLAGADAACAASGWPPGRRRSWWERGTKSSRSILLSDSYGATKRPVSRPSLYHGTRLGASPRWAFCGNLPGKICGKILQTPPLHFPAGLL